MVARYPAIGDLATSVSLKKLFDSYKTQSSHLCIPRIDLPLTWALSVQEVP
jgi:hypothetical protein